MPTAETIGPVHSVHMDTSWQEGARQSPVPGRGPLAGVPGPEEWRASRTQVQERAACSTLLSTFVSQLDELSQHLQRVLVASAYLDGPGFREPQATFREQDQQLAAEYEQSLQSRSGSLPEEEQAEWLDRFKEACSDRLAELQKTSDDLQKIILLRSSIEQAHRARAGISAEASPGTPPAEDGWPNITLGVLQGLASMTGTAGNLSSARGVVSRMAEMAGALEAPASTGVSGEFTGNVRTFTGNVRASLAADRRFWLDLGPEQAGRGAPGAGSPTCSVLDPLADESADRPLIFLARMPGPDQQPRDAAGDADQLPAAHVVACFRGERDRPGPAVGMVISGPAVQVTKGHRALDADTLTRFARQVIFSHVYDGTPHTVAAAMRAAQALEVVALIDPEINAGVWADVDPSRQLATATLLIEGAADGGWTFRTP
jgi:hypothetical protein